jgi:hypothetical protein
MEHKRTDGNSLIKINTKNLSSGCYIIQISSDEENNNFKAIKN